jgi:hypothetical protein
MLLWNIEIRIKNNEYYENNRFLSYCINIKNNKCLSIEFISLLEIGGESYVTLTIKCFIVAAAYGRFLQTHQCVRLFSQNCLLLNFLINFLQSFAHSFFQRQI